MDEGLSSRVENILKDILGDDIDLEKPRSRVEALLLALAEYISEMGGGYQGLSPWPMNPTNSARVYCDPTGPSSADVKICRDVRGYNINDEIICYFSVDIEVDAETSDRRFFFGELTYESGYTPTETDIALCEYIYNYFEDYAQTDTYHFGECVQSIMGDSSDPDNMIPGPSFYVML